MKRYYRPLIWITSFLVSCQLLMPQSQEATSIMEKNSSGVVTFVATDKNKNEVGSGTGFALGEYLIVAPYHLISQAVEAEITTISGKKSKVEALVAVDRTLDLAILKIKDKLESLNLGLSRSLNQGDRLFALNGIKGQIIISEGTLRGWLDFIPETVRLIDTSMSLDKPACGAPIFDVQGKVVGVAMVLGQGIKFGIPIEQVLALNRFSKGVEFKAAPKENYLETVEGAYFAGRSAALLNEPGMTVLYLEKFIKFRPDNLEAYLMIGKGYLQLRNFSESYDNYAKALLLSPDDARVHYGLGLSLLNQRKFKEAAEELEKAIANKIESKEIYFELGTACEEVQDLNRAAENYLKYVQSQPENLFPGWLKLAQTNLKLNQADKAINAYREAIRLKPDDINCNYNLAGLLATTGKYEEADAVYRKLIEINPRDAMTYYGQIIQMYDRAGQYDKAIEAAKKIIELNPKHEVAVYNLAIMYYKLDRFEEAVQALNDCLAIKNDYTYAWYNLGLIYNKQNKHPEAVEAFKKYNALSPEDPNGWLNIGLEYMLMKDFEKALPYLEKSVQLKPDNALAQYNLAITYINLNDSYSAREVLKVLQRLDKSLADRLSKVIK